MPEYTRLRPHWRPTHDADPIGFDRWVTPDGTNAWVKILNPDGHLVRQVWRVAPQAKICLRLHELSEQKDALNQKPSQLGNEHALAWHTWLQTHDLTTQAVAGVLAMEGINEAAIWEPRIAVAYNLYTESFGVKMREYGYTAVLGNINTGHPPNTGPGTLPDWRPLQVMLQTVRNYSHILGLHEYCDQRGPASDDWTWNMGRFLQLPQEFRNLPILMTECGYDWAVNKPKGTTSHGWQEHLSIEQYMDYLIEYDRRIRPYSNVLAAFIFTHDFDLPWSLFDTRPLLDPLCAYAEQVRSLPTLTKPSPQVPTPTLVFPELASGPSVPDRLRPPYGGDPVPIAPPNPMPSPVTSPPVATPVQKRNPARLDYLDWFIRYGQEYDVPWNILASLAYHESAYESNAVSRAGAQGLMQFMPGTWGDVQRSLGVMDPFNGQQSIRASAYYLAQIRSWLPAERREWRWVLAAYNWGPGRVAKVGAWDEVLAETRQYARDIQVGAEMFRRWEESF